MNKPIRYKDLEKGMILNNKMSGRPYLIQSANHQEGDIQIKRLHETNMTPIWINKKRTMELFKGVCD